MHSHWANVNLVLLSSMCVWVPDKPKSGYDTRRKESEPRRSLVMYGSGDVRDRRGGGSATGATKKAESGSAVLLMRGL